MRLSTRVKLALCGAFLLTGFIASGAQAAPLPEHSSQSISPDSLADCPNGWVCFWVDGEFSGAPWSYPAVDFRSLDPGIHDNVSSWANKTPWQYCLYDNGNTELLDTLRPGGNHHTMPAGTNDRADAYGRC
jgi:Peptidase inhibitor family I36